MREEDKLNKVRKQEEDHHYHHHFWHPPIEATQAGHSITPPLRSHPKTRAEAETPPEHHSHSLKEGKTDVAITLLTNSGQLPILSGAKAGYGNVIRAAQVREE